MNINYEKYAKYTLIVLGVLTILSGIGTFFGTLDELLIQWDMLQYATLLGLLKVIGGILLIIPQTKMFGAFFTTAYFGGAVATHVAFSSFNSQFIVVLVLTAIIIKAGMIKYYFETGMLK